MEIHYHKNFQKNYQKRILPNPKLIAKFKQKLSIFLIDPYDPTLKDHQLIGDKSTYRAFWVTGDIRVVYQIFNNQLLLYDIGTHNQVY